LANRAVSGDGRRVVQLLFNQGIMQGQEPSTLLPDEGYATECLNWVPEPTGSLRVRSGWSRGSVTGGIPATRRCRGIGMFARQTDPTIVQASSTFTYVGAGTAVPTPLVTWAAPTQAGNTLVALVAIAGSSASVLTFTATGWTARNALPATTSGTVPACGVYEMVAAESFSGDYTPFTLSLAAGSHAVTVVILELAGVAGFDKVVAASGSNTGVANSPLSQAVTTAATTQASEIVLGFSSALRQNAASTAFALASTSPGFSEYAETPSLAPFTNASAHAGIYSKVVRATGAQSLTVDMTFADEGADNNYQTVVVVTYKGWNTAASPGDIGALWLTALDDGATFDVWSINRDDLAGATWASIDLNIGNTTSGAPVAFTMGLGAAWYTSESFSAIRRFTGGAASAVTGSPAGARCIAVWKNRVWAAVGGRLYWSELADGSTWTKTATSGLGTGYTDGTGADDGEPIEDITPFGDFLVVGKRNSLWAISGDSPANFTTTRLSGGGAAPGRSLIATPYGIIAAGIETVYRWDGSSGVQPISRGIQASYGLTGAYLTCSYQDGSVYVCDAGSGVVFVFDLLSGVWRTEQVASAAEAPAVVYNYSDRQVYGPKAAVTVAPLNYRDFPATTRAKDFTTLVGESFAATTSELWLAGPDGRFSPDFLWCKVRQRAGAATDPALVVTATYGDESHPEGVDQPPQRIRPRQVGASHAIYRTRLAMGTTRGVTWARFRFTLDLGAAETAVVDIEEAVLGYIDDGDRW